MTWLAWRQFRLQAFVAAAVAVALAGLFLSTGPHLAHLYATSGLARCPASNACPAQVARFFNEAKLDAIDPVVFFVGVGVLILLPAVIGAFWGAPLITREIESSSFKLTWNQGITRSRWMVVKLGLVGLAAAATSGLVSLGFTWWVSPVDRAGGFPDNMSQWSKLSPLMFVDRGIVPIGWAVLAFVVGVTVGLLIRRTVPAMAVTLVLIVALQFLWPGLIRPHLRTPSRTATPIAAGALAGALVTNAGGLIIPTNQPGLAANLSGAWIVSNTTITRVGRVFVLPAHAPCQNFLGAPACVNWLAAQRLRQVVRYVPASDFWPLQWEEATVLLALATGFGGLCTWRVRYLLT